MECHHHQTVVRLNFEFLESWSFQKVYWDQTCSLMSRLQALIGEVQLRECYLSQVMSAAILVGKVMMQHILESYHWSRSVSHTDLSWTWTYLCLLGQRLVAALSTSHLLWPKSEVAQLTLALLNPEARLPENLVLSVDHD